MNFNVDLVVFEARGEFISKIPRGVNLVALGTTNLINATIKLSKYIKTQKLQAMIANGDRCIMAAFSAGLLSPGGKHKTIGVVHNDLIGATVEIHGRSKKDLALAKFKQFPMRFIYRHISHIVAVSNGTADSVAKFLAYPRDKIKVIYNPIPTAYIRERAMEPVDHHWFVCKNKPVIVSVGRLAPEKDYPTLIRAFKILTKDTPARLIIVGEGGERRKIEALIRELDLEASVDLIGFQENPYKYMQRADLFAQSSLFEGFSITILESMSLGTPAISTDCPSGPAELLARHPNRLVPISNPSELAAALKRDIAVGKEENDIENFSIDKAVKYYIELIL
jgi:glycosyltransferase involved in cell wall biosynthesis